MYDFVALTWRTIAWCDDPLFVSNMQSFLAQGWEEYIRAPRPLEVRGGACIMCRLKDKLPTLAVPCKWTREQIREIAREVVVCDEADSILEDARIEADMQAAYRAGGIDARGEAILGERVMLTDENCRLKRRNEELQAAIDEVVHIAQGCTYEGDYMVRIVGQFLCPLATKKGIGAVTSCESEH